MLQVQLTCDVAMPISIQACSFHGQPSWSKNTLEPWSHEKKKTCFPQYLQRVG